MKTKSEKEIEAGAIFYLWKEGNFTFEDLAEIFGKSIGTVHNLMKTYYSEIDFKAEGLKRSHRVRKKLEDLEDKVEDKVEDSI